MYTKNNLYLFIIMNMFHKYCTSKCYYNLFLNNRIYHLSLFAHHLFDQLVVSKPCYQNLLIHPFPNFLQLSKNKLIVINKENTII